MTPEYYSDVPDPRPAVDGWTLRAQLIASGALVPRSRDWVDLTPTRGRATLLLDDVGRGVAAQRIREWIHGGRREMQPPGDQVAALIGGPRHAA